MLEDKLAVNPYRTVTRQSMKSENMQSQKSLSSRRKSSAPRVTEEWKDILKVIETMPKSQALKQKFNLSR